MSMPHPHAPWIGNLRYHIEVNADPYRTEEVIARMSDLTMARAMFDLAVVQFPGKLIMLCQRRASCGAAIGPRVRIQTDENLIGY